MYLDIPRYSCESDLSVPSYSSEPLVGERRLEYHIAPATRSPIRTGTYTKANEHVALFLEGQDSRADFPTYGRNFVIRGEVFLKPKDREKISNVTLKVISTEFFIVSHI